ncbi:MAG: SUMF1/EgtB/PvdO family nonheme iron enzyme, partial [Planctomycetota bacterium]
EAAELEKQGKFRAARETIEAFLAKNAGAKQSAEANRRIEALSTALATDLAGREANAHAALGPLRRRVETTADPLHQSVYAELVRELHDIATRYDGAKSAAAAEERRTNEAGAAITHIEALLSAEEGVAAALRKAQESCAAWLDRFGDRAEEASEVQALAAQTAERLEATLQTGKWRERLTKLQELFDRTPGAWTRILNEARALRAHATDAEVVTEAAKIERVTLARLDGLAEGTREKVQALARGHAERGDLPAALQALRGFDLKLFGDTEAAATIRREIERVPLEWVEAEEAELVQRARTAAEAARTRYADTPYAEQAGAMHAKVTAAADARAAHWLEQAAELEAAGNSAEALAVYRRVAAAGNAAQRDAASAKGIELRGRVLLHAIRTHLASEDWSAAAQAAERALVDPSLLAIHPAAQALRTHARALAGGMVYVAGALVPRAGGGKTAVPPFYIDRLEVSAAQYKEFVDAGGYRDDRWWPAPLGLEVRLKRFRDRTGRAGPRIWRAGAPPEGTTNHPVRGITWHEATAYARFRGKQLPTGQQWIAAAGWDGAAKRLRTYPWGDRWDPAKAYAGEENLKSPTMPVDSLPDGASPSGCLHMAGNVREWTADPFDQFKNPDGEKLIMGCGAVSLDPAEEAKVTARHSKSPDSAGDDVGIRLVLPAPAADLLGLQPK